MSVSEISKSIFILFFFTLLWSCQSTTNTITEEERTLDWQFPLKRTHTGMLLGNGVQGLMIWGYENKLNITIGRAGFWDHRGGNDFSSRTTFQDVKEMLYSGDGAALKDAFAYPEREENYPNRPQQVGGGRLELLFPESYNLESGILHLNNGIALIKIKDSKGILHEIKIRQSVFSELSWIELPDALSDTYELNLVASWDYVKNTLEAVGVAPPERWNNDDSGGFLQTLPEDDPLAIAYKSKKGNIIISSAIEKEAKITVINNIESFNKDEIIDESETWWNNYWKDVPKIQLPDPVLQEIVDYGQYKLASVTPPHGIACSLQGPFNEEYRLPPWSNDYHFNINIEMIYWPVLASNRLDHLNPVWDMLYSWWPQLSKNGEQFFQQKGAIMLPHAVDDRCKVVGTFWTGTIDHACTAWMAQLAWMHYRFSMDKEILREKAWPIMIGSFEGYWAMLEEIKDTDGNTVLSLPVSVSPEFKGSRMDAWGRDASFQLAALRMTAENLQKGAEILKIELDPRWQEVLDKVPEYTLIKGSRTLENPEQMVDRIALWEGMDLIESHRHHSYLGGIWPFMTFDPLDQDHFTITRNTLFNWVLKGPGRWSGWCVPWASIINSRVNNVRAAVDWLHWWNNNFTNEGRGTLHNAAFKGSSTIDSPDYSLFPPGRPHGEIMQLDAGFGALSAIYEILIQNRRGTLYVLPEIPFTWKELSFENILTEGAFLISAKVRHGEKIEIRVVCQEDGQIKLAHGFGDTYELNGDVISGKIFERICKKGEELVLTPAN